MKKILLFCALSLTAYSCTAEIVHDKSIRDPRGEFDEIIAVDLDLSSEERSLFQDFDNITPLIRSTLLDDAEHVKELLDYHVNPNLVIKDKKLQCHTALHIAAARGQLTVVRHLLNAQADAAINFPVNDTPLLRARTANQQEVVDYFTAIGIKE